MDKVDAIISLRPGARWHMNDDVLVWEDEEQVEPTEEEIQTEIARLQSEYDSQDYARKRKAEYNALNQFELISDDAINGTTTHRDAILAIKAKYPKPE
jgi:FKBP-type peptidyl-prolyl cis-trans isomerase (trigger factor)